MPIYLLHVSFSLRLILFPIIINGYWILVVVLTYALMCRDKGIVGSSTREIQTYELEIGQELLFYP